MKVGDRIECGFQLLKDMAYLILKQRKQAARLSSRLIAVCCGIVFAVTVAHAQPQFGQGFSHAGQVAPANPAESSAYSAAISQSDPQARASAIQQFLIQYPNSPLRQSAIAQMMLAKRDTRAPGTSPAQPMNRPMIPHPAADASMVSPAPAPAQSFPPQQMSQTPRDSLLQHPAKPAEVTMVPGSLNIKADNSSLSQILQEISQSTGMKVEGLGQDERIFGSYGPGEPREVLLSLLDGSGYNVLMVGDSKGAPRELSLSRRSASNSLASANNPARNTTMNRDTDDDEIEQEQPQAPPEQPQPVNQPPPGNPDGMQSRTPADIQQELLRLRQQQMQQPPQQ